MTWFQAPGSRPGQYIVTAASQTNSVIGNTGAVGDYLESITIVPNGAATAVTLKDGVGGSPVTVFTTLGTLTVPVTLKVKMYSVKPGGWNVTTGANVTTLCVGQFS